MNEETNFCSGDDIPQNFQDFITSMDNFDLPNFDTAFDQSPIYTANIENHNTPQATTTYIARIDENNEEAGLVLDIINKEST